MFNSIKENQYIKKFIELWNNPRYRSMLTLGLYIIFFALIITFINSGRTNTTSNTNKVDIMTRYERMNNYRYRATIKNDGKKTLIGKVYENKQLILFNDNNYYYNNVLFYKQEEKLYKPINDKLFDFEIWRINPMFISQLIKKGKFDARTEYADGTLANKYLVKTSEFIKLYFGDDTETSEYINITLYQNNEKIIKVELDLTSIYHQNQYSNAYDYEIIIEYDMIGQMNPITVNIEGSD